MTDTPTIVSTMPPENPPTSSWILITLLYSSALRNSSTFYIYDKLLFSFLDLLLYYLFISPLVV